MVGAPSALLPAGIDRTGEVGEELSGVLEGVVEGVVAEEDEEVEGGETMGREASEKVAVMVEGTVAGVMGGEERGIWRECDALAPIDGLAAGDTDGGGTGEAEVAEVSGEDVRGRVA